MAANYANYVRFLRGTPTAYENLPKKDSDTLYFISEKNSDSGVLYLGTKLISGAVSIYTSVEALQDILLKNLKQGDILVYNEDKQKWVNASIPELATLTVRMMTGATEIEDGQSGLVPEPKAGDQNKFLRGDGTWANFTVPVMTGASSSKAGTSGLVPTPKKGSQDLFLRGDGSWAKVTGTLTDDMIQDFSNLKSTVSRIVGDYTDKTIYQIAVQALEDSLIAANAAEDLNSLGEIADWIQSTNNKNNDFNDRILALENFVYTGTGEQDGNTSVIIQGLRTSVGNLTNIINEMHPKVEMHEESIIELNERTTWRDFAQGDSE